MGQITLGINHSGLDLDLLGVSLIFDTAHITMGAHSRPRYLLELLAKCGDRIHSFHFKDYTPNATGKDYFELVENGCFPELGHGIVDFAAVKAWQERTQWAGWIVVEQDMRPLEQGLSRLRVVNE